MDKKDIIGRYNLPVEVKFCKKCTVSNQRPRISFDEYGVCSACNYAEYKRQHIDWEERERELVDCNRNLNIHGLVSRSGATKGNRNEKSCRIDWV